jgi:hypothetical protein
MTSVVLRRWLKVADPTALTAREALQRGLGLGRAVEEVHRSELFALRWAGSVDGVPLVRQLAAKTNLLVNPNKHFLEVRAGEERLEPRGNLWVMIWTVGDGEALAETLERRNLLHGDTPRLRRALLWELQFSGEAGERRRRAESITWLRSREEGLLANPELQEAHIFEAAPGVLEIGDRLFS